MLTEKVDVVYGKSPMPNNERCVGSNGVRLLNIIISIIGHSYTKCSDKPPSLIELVSYATECVRFFRH